jgi:hypothetical protein
MLRIVFFLAINEQPHDDDACAGDDAYHTRPAKRAARSIAFDKAGAARTPAEEGIDCSFALHLQCLVLDRLDRQRGDNLALNLIPERPVESFHNFVGDAEIDPGHEAFLNLLNTSITDCFHLSRTCQRQDPKSAAWPRPATLRRSFLPTVE